jgi:outer membrane protein TolC
MNEYSARKVVTMMTHGRGKVRVFLGFLTCLLCLGLAAVETDADPILVSPQQPDLSVPPTLAIQDGVLQLSLEDAVAIALERNLSLVVERFAQEEAELAILQNKGIYDLFTTADFQKLADTSPAASNLDGALVQEFELMDVDLGLEQLVSTGGRVRFDWDNNEQKTNSLFATLNPSYRIDMDLTFIQPLLRNRGKLATNRNLLIAQTNRSISRETFELQVTDVILRVESAYWNLAESIAQLQVAEESLDLAKQLHEQNMIRVEVGTLAPLELVQSEAGVASREVEIIRARAAIGDRSDVLRQLMNLERSGEMWDLPIAPTSDPFEQPETVGLDEAIEIALQNRPEIRQQDLALENRQVDVDYFKNQRKARLDFAGTYGLNGVGGDVTDPDFPSDGDYLDAMDQILNADFDGWRVALNFAFPIQNRTAKANSAIADVNYERAMAVKKDVELGVITEVRRVARALEASLEAVESAEVSRRLQEKNYEAEQKRYDNGMSTSFQVLQIQEDLTTARSQYVDTVAAYRRALALHYQSIGKLIEESGVAIVE